MHERHRFLRDFLWWLVRRRLVDWNDFRGDEHFLFFKRNRRKKETSIFLEYNLPVAHGIVSNFVSLKTGQGLHWERLRENTSSIPLALSLDNQLLC